MAATADALGGAQASTRSYFYFWMATAMAATAFIGFAPTFWIPMTHGAYVARPVFALHGIVFSIWPLFLMVQTWLVASGQTAYHREMGLAGIALASVMTVLGIMAAIAMVERNASVGATDAGLAFMILPLWHVLGFALLVGLAIANIRRPDWHKRLMLMATVVLLDAPIARLFIFFLGFHGHMPVPAGLPPTPPPDFGPMTIDANEWVENLFIVVPIVFDWRTLGRPHPAYLYCGAGMVLMQLFDGPLGGTAVWHAIARWLVSLAG